MSAGSTGCSNRYFVPFDRCESNEVADDCMCRFDLVITDFMREQGIPGGAIALSYNGRLIHRQGYGSAGNGTNCLSTSYFRIASISKTITAMTIMQLVEQQKVQLKDKIFNRKGKGILGNFTPGGPSVKALEGITVRHLLEHSGGWDRETGVDPVYLPSLTVCPVQCQGTASPLELYTNYHQNLTQYMIKQKLDFKPGTRHGYSNFGYLVLGQVLEKLTGIPYPIYIQDIISRVGDCWVYEGDELHRLHPNEVRYFEKSDSIHPSIMPEHGEIWSLQYGGYHMRGTGSYGGLVASPVQLLSLLSMLDVEHWKGNKTLSKESISQMLARPKFEKGSEWYGLGLDVEDKGQTWGHTGYMDGTTTTFRREKNGYSWVLLFNAGATDQDLDGLVKFALSSRQSYEPLSDLKNKGVNVKSLQISSKDGVQIYHILLPLKEMENYACCLKARGYYMQDIDLVVYENSFYVNIIWNYNRAKIDWFYKIYHSASVTNLDTEYDIIDQIKNGFKIHTLSVCTDIKHQTDIYTAVIYVRQDTRTANQHLAYLQEVSFGAPLDLQGSRNFVLCSVCYYREKLFVTTVFEDSNSCENLVPLDDDDMKHSVDLTSEKCNRELNERITGDLSNANCNLTCNHQGNSVLVNEISGTLVVDSSRNDTLKPCRIPVVGQNKGEKQFNIAKQNLTEEEFLDELRFQALDNFGLIYLQIYNLPTRKDTLISAVWSKFKVHECYQRVGASRFSFMNELMESSGGVTPMEMIRAYKEDGVLLFAGIWTAGEFKSKRLKLNKCPPNSHSKRKRKK